MNSRPLNEVPWEMLMTGDKVISAKGVSGSIVSTKDESIGIDPDWDKLMVFIKWDNGNYSLQPHILLNAITWISR